MSTKFTFTIFTVLLFCIDYTQAQFRFRSKVILASGSLTEILKEEHINVRFDYQNTRIGSRTEEEYINKKVASYAKRRPERGDKWRTKWVNARKEKYEPKFLTRINKRVRKSKIGFSENPSAKYTLIVRVTHLHIGFHFGVVSSPAGANFEFLFVENSDPTVVIARVYAQQIISSRTTRLFNYKIYNMADPGSRIAPLYKRAGKKLGKFLMKSKK